MTNTKQWHDLVRHVATAPHQIVALDAAAYLETRGYDLAHAAHDNTKRANRVAHRKVDPILSQVPIPAGPDARARAKARARAADRSRAKKKADSKGKS